MNSARFALVLLAVFLSGGCQALTGVSPTPTLTPTPDWTVFCAPDGGFSVLMPGIPDVTEGRFDVGNGPTDRYTYGLNFNSIAYNVAYLPRPPAVFEQNGVTGTLKDLTEGFAGRQKYKILSAQDVPLGQSPGHEVVYLAAASVTDTTKLVTRFRLYAVGDRLYLLKAAAPTSKSLSPDIKQFINSFQLLDSAGCQQAIELPALPALAATPTLAATFAAGTEWKTFTSQIGGFSLMMPGQPVLTQQPMDTPSGQLTSQFFQSQTDDGRIFSMAGYTDYPSDLVKQANADRVLSSSRDGLVQMVNGKLLSEKKIILEHYPGRDLVVEVAAGQQIPGAVIARVRTFFVQNRQYIVVVLTSKTDYPSAKVEEVLDSFQLLAK